MGLIGEYGEHWTNDLVTGEVVQCDTAEALVRLRAKNYRQLAEDAKKKLAETVVGIITGQKLKIYIHLAEQYEEAVRKLDKEGR